MGGLCSKSNKDKANKPTGIWTGQETYLKTDGYKNFFGRNWYFQAHTAPGNNRAELNDYMCESYGWLEGKEGKTGLVGFNHTVDRKNNGKATNYPRWNVYIRENDKGIEMTPKMFCNLNAPFNMRMDFLSFPENDRRDQCWTWLGSVGGTEFLVIANL